MSQYRSEKGSDPLEASRFHYFFGLAGEGQTPFRKRFQNRLRIDLVVVLFLASTVPVAGAAAEDAAGESAVVSPANAEPEWHESEITEDEREHWAFLPVDPPQPPAGGDSAIDGFIDDELRRRGLTPSPEAPRHVLLRRLSYDLIGLPPTPEELAEFEADESPNAYRRQVDRLLASPEYGKRWAQHWLDLARFAESDGFEHDKVRTDAWRYRDWVIRALNEDMPYDRFVALQLAGDLSDDPANRAAAMFLLSGPDMPDINDQVERRHNLLNEMASTVGAVFLGLQVGCAQCHDHKYDPISQADFYRLRAVFEPAIPKLRRGVHCLTPESASFDEPPRIWPSGDLTRQGPIVPAAVPRIAVDDSSLRPLTAEPDARLQLVEYLFAEGNPLTARVIVNRLWQHHFGVGIFDSPSDAGVMMAGPTHPELLDYLADQLRERNWSLKQLHRMILLSSTYRRTSYRLPGDEAWEARLAADPDNRLLARYPRRRLEGESLRDAMLAVSGRLCDEGGGPGVYPPLPAELQTTLLKGQWTTAEREADHCRRSIYVFARRNLRYPIFDVFDRPDAGASCPRRSLSTTATQSLQLFNSEFSWQAATALARRVSPAGEAPLDDAVWERLFRLMLSRSPTAGELRAIQEFVLDDAIAADQRLPAVCLALINSNEFLTID